MAEKKTSPDKSQDVWKDTGENVEFATLELTRKDQKATQEGIQDFADRSQSIIRSMRIREPEANLRVAIGFSSKAWDYLFPKADKPKELIDFEGVKGPKYSMPSSEGDIFLHIRANTEAVVYEVTTQFMLFLRDFTKVVNETHGFRYLEGRAIIGFIDGTEVPQVEDIAPYALIGDEDPEFINGSYAFAQKWHHDMDYWNKLNTTTQDKAIGREKFSDLELPDEEKFKNAHNVTSNTSVNGVEQKIVRMNVPYSDPANNDTGTYFIAYSRYWHVIQGMLQQMVDQNDFLLTFSTLLTGQTFFIPSRPLLGKIADGDLN
ncbi:Dyp-type peroxidase [Fructilactobacillus fructivorans]|uniref:Dyp-type peroxidase n=1 Tax=Fructilactobacillus fructivorans TaxID=1614 RepID=A0AAE6P0H0_9LACO|nr:Dyp-type peroxidase [Fructilactobacillus fructivorans]KRK58647.1 Dyp-type peroxidase family protein [Fructilactobacillus fructivorans]KRN40201.1 Dyp-type peroxidase family protein [Fructilactobacillus fructivorans]KRN43466.1 Dyp-type peroxidase family protein [Fructilactobacillus fructivorans]QFX92650.1 Dyp-type peroxidase [Fructilactobacillus fructivorans]RDV65757.1 Dyp-type peroxidase [Fructilactobacillus fructivorans]